jgi:S-formylglutathione hydrolase FrmB
MAPNARTVEVSICSKALNRVVSARVVLPPSYYQPNNPDAPLLYLLHGANLNASINEERDYRDWTNNSDVEETVTANTNAFVITPEGGPIGWYSDWLGTPNAIVNWQVKPWPQRWESHFFDELLPLLEARFKNNGQRVIAGLSMGGMGAIAYAARAPAGKTFRAAASFSGGLSLRANYAIPQGELVAKAQDPNILWGDPNATDNVWKEHDPRWLVDRLVNLPIWVASGNGSGTDAVEFGAWGMSTDYANAQDAAIHRVDGGGYVVRDMGDTTAPINQGCPGKHDWNNWPNALKRAWPWIKANLSGITPAKPTVPPCGEIPTSF